MHVSPQWRVIRQGGGGMSHWGLYIILVNHFVKSTLIEDETIPKALWTRHRACAPGYRSQMSYPFRGSSADLPGGSAKLTPFFPLNIFQFSIPLTRYARYAPGGEMDTLFSFYAFSFTRMMYRPQWNIPPPPGVEYTPLLFTTLYIELRSTLNQSTAHATRVMVKIVDTSTRLVQSLSPGHIILGGRRTHIAIFNLHVQCVCHHNDVSSVVWAVIKLKRFHLYNDCSSHQWSINFVSRSRTEYQCYPTTLSLKSVIFLLVQLIHF